jgi:putative hydrolase of the HAD superfamily
MTRDVWVFDLDNTLYPASCRLFDQVNQRMTAFVAELLDMELDAARTLQKAYYHEHGTTLRGLMLQHGVDPRDFLAYVHEIDVSPVPPNPELDRALDGLPGRKVIFTNGPTHHAERVVERLGVARHFSGVFDIAAADYRPKPMAETYDAMLRALAVDPHRATMFEDIARNLVPAAALGMTTVLVQDEHPWLPPDQDVGPGHEAIHHVTEDLAGWLLAVVDRVPDAPEEQT